MKQQALQQQPMMPSAKGLKLRDVKVARTVDQGVAILTVEGTIANTGDEDSRVHDRLPHADSRPDEPIDHRSRDDRFGQRRMCNRSASRLSRRFSLHRP
jgi:hypothetical protein